MPIPVTDEELRGYFSQILRQRREGYQVNLETAIIKRACQAYRRGSQGPGALRRVHPGHPGRQWERRNVVRQDFTAGIAEYDPATGQVNWVEVVTNSDAIRSR